MKTQRDLVLSVLDGREHATIEFVKLGILRLPSRVHELREHGFVIECKRRGPSSTYVYRLVSQWAESVTSSEPERAIRADANDCRAAQLALDDELNGPRLAQADDLPTLPEPVKEEVEIPASLEERRRIAAEARVDFERALRRCAP